MGLLFPPFWILASSEHKNKVIFEGIREAITPYANSKDLVLIMGISKDRPEEIRLNFFDRESGKTDKLLILSYHNPGKITWLYDKENKFVRIFKNVLTEPILVKPEVKDKDGKIIQEAVYVSPDLSCN